MRTASRHLAHRLPGRLPLLLVAGAAALAAQTACSSRFDGADTDGASHADPAGIAASAAADAGPEASPLGAPTVGTQRCSNDVTSLKDFAECPDGGGRFGKWIVDRGLPAFSFEMDQRSDGAGAWVTTTPGLTRRDHWHMSGNARLNFLAADDGYVSVFGNERGAAFYNRFDEDQNNLGGGFSYVNDGGEVYATAYKYSPFGAKTRRVFGMSYFETENEWNGLRVTHTIHAPFGDDAFVLDDVVIENTGSAPKSVAHYEYWDINRHQLETEWLRTGHLTQEGDRTRDGLNGSFTQAVAYDAARKTLTGTMTPKGSRPGANVTSEVDSWPAPVFLTCLTGDVDGIVTDQRAFFGGDAYQPSAVATKKDGGPLAPVDAAGQPAAMVMRSNLAIAPGEKKTMRFAYGYVPQGKSADDAKKYATVVDPLASTLAAWKEKLAYVAVPGMPYIQRETAWRSQLLQAQTVHNDYWNTTYTPQGSVYLYGHGVDGVARDQSLYAAATTYLDPSLAKGNLRMAMGVTDAKDGHKWYSFEGYGMTGDALGLHTWPSDLDIFFLFALGEYLDATGDTAFLDEQVDFYPRGSTSLPPGANGRTVLDHARVAYRHLHDKVGTGFRGLIHIGDGDWSDGIVYQDISPLAQASTKLYGESVPNTQMAIVALPLAADAIAARDPALAADLRGYAQGLVAAAKGAFGTKWFGRAWLYNTFGTARFAGNDQGESISLESQPWGLLADVLDPAQRGHVLDEVESRLDAPSSIGPALSEHGQVWPAISQLMTWAYARYRPASAWRSLGEQLYTSHASTYPTVWGGVLSMADGVDTSDGRAWSSPATPMSDFPVSNANPDAMWILALLRTAGVEPAKGGLSISPRHAPGYETYTIDLPLLRLDVTPKRIAGIYRAKNDGQVTLTVGIGTASAAVKVNGVAVSAPVSNGQVLVPLTFHRGDQVSFDATGS